MFSLKRSARFLQRTVCLLTATTIVGGSIALAGVAAEYAACLDYTVTITQLA